MRLILLILIANLMTWNGLLGAAEEAPPLPTAAQSAMDKLEKSETKLNKEHTKAVNAERAKTITDLQKVLKDITKTGDLDSALIVKKQIDDLTA
jgi:hypothetical protein